MAASLFGGTSNTTTTFQPITIGASLLTNMYSAQLALSASTASENTALAKAISSSDPAVIPPWKIDTEPKTLARRLSEVRNLDKFIDLKSADVKRAGDNPDNKATFALFNALTALQTLAQAASEDSRPDSSLPRLDEQFQKGLKQVQDYLGAVELNKLTLMFGEKKNRVTTGVSLGANSTGYTGGAIHKGDRADAIAGLTGNEVFTVSIAKGGATEDIQVDLSQISGTLNLDNVVDHINNTIAAIPLLDENGNVKLDANGDPVSKYKSRFKVTGNSADGYALKLEGSLLESLKLSTPPSDPVLYVTGTSKSIVLDGPTVSQLTKISDLNAADPSIGFKQAIAASDADQAALNEASGSDAAPAALETKTGAVATDADGNIFVVGTSTGDFGNQRGDGAKDVFLTKYDSNGQVMFTRLLGSAGDAEGFSVATDADGNVVVAGQVDGKIKDGDALAGQDSFVVKFSGNGDEAFRFQLDTAAADGAASVATAANGDIIVAGYAGGTIKSSLSAQGGTDAYLLRLDANSGAVVDAAQFGTANKDAAKAVTVAADGSVLVGSVEDGRAIVRKFDGADFSNQLAQQDLGALAGGKITGIGTATVGGVDKIVVAGMTNTGGLAGSQIGGYAGSNEGFVSILTDNGGLSVDSTRYIGTTEVDSVNGLAVSGDKVYVAGQTAGALSGQTRKGAVDSFVAQIDIASGNLDSLKQFGAFGARAQPTGLALSTQSGGVLSTLGLRSGALTNSETRDIVTQTAVNAGDFFYISIDGKRPTKITIKDGDTFARLAARINTLSFRGVKASVGTGDDAKLEIKAQNGSTIDIIAGDQGHDALARLGLMPTKILSSELLFKADAADDLKPDANLGGVFGLKLDSAFHLRDKTTAKYVLSQIDEAVGTVQRAFRSLTFDPIAYALQQQSKYQGDVPAYLNNQLANYKDALLRLQIASQSSSSSSTGGLF